jgi:hypothetical protein
MKYAYTFDYQLNGSDGIIGWGDLTISCNSKMNHSDLKEARAEILKRARQDWNANPMNRMMRGGCPIASVTILNIWETVA